MSEPVHTSETPATGAPEPAESPTPEQPKPPAELPAEPKPTETVDYWKQRARQNEAQAKANAEAARKLKEIEDRDLSELQKAQRDAEEARTRLQEIEQEAVRYRVAAQYGISREDADEFLFGNDEESVSRKAQRFLERTKQGPITPRPDLGQGARPNPPQTEEDLAYEALFGRG